MTATTSEVSFTSRAKRERKLTVVSGQEDVLIGDRPGPQVSRPLRRAINLWLTHISDCASHPPNPNPFEMRNSSPLELISASLGFKPIHILEDGTKKSPSQIVADSTAFKERGQWLTAQENWYPHPKQTSVREKARAEMLRELNYLKAAETISLEERGFGNHNALLRYEKVLEEQKDAREVANAELYGGCKDWSEKASE